MTAKELKKAYPKGTRIVLIHMADDDPRPIPDGTKGSVIEVDDEGTIHCHFDCGRELGMIPGVDTFAIIDQEE